MGAPTGAVHRVIALDAKREPAGFLDTHAGSIAPRTACLTRARRAGVKHARFAIHGGSARC